MSEISIMKIFFVEHDLYYLKKENELSNRYYSKVIFFYVYNISDNSFSIIIRLYN